MWDATWLMTRAVHEQLAARFVDRGIDGAIALNLREETPKGKLR